MAARLQAEWVAVYVETPAQLHLAEADREQLERTLRLAEQLGAETATLTGGDDVEEILAYARRRNVTKLVVGKPAEPRWRDAAARLVRGAGWCGAAATSTSTSSAASAEDEEPREPAAGTVATAAGPRTASPS